LEQEATGIPAHRASSGDAAGLLIRHPNKAATHSAVPKQMKRDGASDDIALKRLRRKKLM
jgi:hypothetical protein